MKRLWVLLAIVLPRRRTPSCSVGPRVPGSAVARAASILGSVLLTAAGAAADGRAPTPSIFAPVSTPAFAIREIAMFVLGITGVIFLVVGGLGVYVLVRFRR